jgi:nitrogen regulatory protein PII
MALTNEGLVIRRFPEVQEAIQAAVLQNVSTKVIFDEDLLMTQVIDIVAAEIASLEEVVESVYDSLDRDKSEGTSLDSLLHLIGIQRIGQALTSGDELFVGDDGTNIPKGTILSNPSTGERFETTIAGSLLQESCLSCDYQVDTIAGYTSYTVSINGGGYSYTSGNLPTDEDIIDGLIAAINTPNDRSWEASKQINPFRLRVNTNGTDKISLSVLSDLLPERVTGNINIAALEFGPIRAPVKSVTQVITAVGGVTSVTNLEALGLGRQRETDEAFRLRASQSLALTGSCTIPALTAALLNVSSVTSATVVENITNAVVEGRPVHSFEAVVTAPINDAIDVEIATAIWNDKPTGIRTFGNTMVTIIDSAGNQQDIYFSRPVGTAVATRVTYTLYEEEVFPDNGPELIQKAVAAYGNALSAGEDVIPKKLYGAIYTAVPSGLGSIVVECQTTFVQGQAPYGVWSEDRISINTADTASFNIIDVYTVEL